MGSLTSVIILSWPAPVPETMRILNPIADFPVGSPVLIVVEVADNTLL